jgi:uncharacterized protein YdiU (UPF0061 family)
MSGTIATRIAQMSSHINGNGNASSGVTLDELPKSWNFTKHLPADAEFPTPADSYKVTNRRELGPRMVKNALFTYVRPEEAKNPELLAVSKAALRDIGIKESETQTEDFKQLVAGNKLYGWDAENMEGGYPWAQCYGGWQFGSWAGQLGDGRAISLFETTNPSTNHRYELQLKGAGITPYSRFADGKAVLRSSIREFVVSEALNALRFPTTRALSLTLLPEEQVRRETFEPGAIVARFAESWLRVGNFDILRARGDRDNVRKLADYLAEHVFGGWENLPARLEDTAKPETSKGVPKDDLQGPEGLEENRYARLYREIVRRNAKCVAYWQAYGFMNGVLNTDNTSLFGLSLDFGPFAFMDVFDPDYTPNHDDAMLRYSFRNQATIIWWNLVRLGESLGELIGIGDKVDAEEFVEKGIKQEDADALIKRAEGLITRTGEEYKTVFMSEYKRLMSARLGLKTEQPTDFQELYSELLDTMEAIKLDFNSFFRKLSSTSVSDLESEEGRKDQARRFFHHETAPDDADLARVAKWLAAWRERVVADWSASADSPERTQAMKQANPNFIPRGWILDEVIDRVQNKGERKVLEELMVMSLEPFRDVEEWEFESQEAREQAERWVGDVPKLKIAMQCSCSS